jgi:hypothetical protein
MPKTALFFADMTDSFFPRRKYACVQLHHALFTRDAVPGTLVNSA